MKNLFLLILLCFLSSCLQKEKEVEKYGDGSIKYEVTLVDGKRHGELVKYYPDGSVEGTSTWKQGMLHGTSTVYYSNGKIAQVNMFQNGVRYGRSEFYSENGALIETQFLNDNGELIDYKKFGSDGEQVLDVDSKKALYFDKRDTIHVGDKFHIKMRIGNHIFNNIRGHIGDPNENSTLHSPQLPKSDSITVFYETVDYEIGQNIIEGLLVDLPSDHEKRQKFEIHLVPFQFSFFVRDTTRLSMNESIKNTALR